MYACWSQVTVSITHCRRGGVWHANRDLSPSKLSQASGSTAASLKWNLASNNSSSNNSWMEGVSFPTSFKWNSNRGTVPPYHHHHFVPQTRPWQQEQGWLEGLHGCHFAPSSPCYPESSRSGLNLCRALSQQAKSLQKSPLFLSVFGLKCGVSPGCGSTAMHALTHACAPTLSCTCAHKSTRWPICFPGADSHGVKWKHLTNSKKLREKKREERWREGKRRAVKYNFTVEWNLLKELSCQDVRKEDQYSSVSMQ